LEDLLEGLPEETQAADLGRVRPQAIADTGGRPAQERYRAGQGLFDTDTGPNGTTIVSQLQTVGAVAADFTGDGNTDLVALNANTDSFSLLRNQGNGSFADPQANDHYFTPPNALQVLAGDFLTWSRWRQSSSTTPRPTPP